MKKYVWASLAFVSLLISTSSIAQSDVEKKEKEQARSAKKRAEADKVKAKEEAKRSEDYIEIEDREGGLYREVEDAPEEIIIRRKGDKKSTVTIEINGKTVKVNGKPIDEFEDENVAILRRTQPRLFSADSRFRSMAPAWGNKYPGGVQVIAGNRAFLGVTTDDVEDGAEIESVVEGSAAEKAGLKKGDVITSINDNKIENAGDLTKVIGKFKPENEVTITYKRDGKENKVKATLDKNKNVGVGQSYSFSGPGVFEAPLHISPDNSFELELDRFNRGQYNYDFSFGKPRLGIKAQDTEEGKGVKVLEISKESLAEKAGIKVGDIITSFDGKTINSADELVEAAQESREKPAVKVEFLRDGKAQSIEIKTPKKLKTANL